MADLRSTMNTPEIREQVEKAAAERFKDGTVDVFFEHGHWWARRTNDNYERTYDVVDVDADGVDEFDFELVEEMEVERTPQEQAEHEKKMEEIAVEVRKFLMDRGLWIDTRIYFNGKAFCSCPVYDHGDGKLSQEYKSGARNINYNNPEYLHVIENIDPAKFMDYYNRDTITMSFEGGLYEALNYGHVYGYDIEDELRAIFEKHGYYYELGNAWNLSIYPR